MAIIKHNMLNIKSSPYNNNLKNTQNNKFKNGETNTFSDILKNKQAENKTNIHFSKHASNRLDNRNLNLSNSQIKRVEKGIKLAQEKGITDSLVVVDNISLLVNVKNKTVVTAIDNNEEKVYTNINGAVIV